MWQRPAALPLRAPLCAQSSTTQDQRPFRSLASADHASAEPYCQVPAFVALSGRSQRTQLCLCLQSLLSASEPRVPHLSKQASSARLPRKTACSSHAKAPSLNNHCSFGLWKNPHIPKGRSQATTPDAQDGRPHQQAGQKPRQPSSFPFAKESTEHPAGSQERNCRLQALDSRSQPELVG